LSPPSSVPISLTRPPPRSTLFPYTTLFRSFERARVERRSFIPTGFAVKPLDQRPGELPPLKLDHLQRMTDDTGMIQHANFIVPRSEEHTSELQSRENLVCRLLLEKKKNITN